MLRPARLLLVCLLFLATIAVVWTGVNLPPPLWILKYSPSPGCEPEGVETVGGIEFIVIGPGIARIGSSWAAENDWEGATSGDLLGRVARPTGLVWGEAAVPCEAMPVHWVEFPDGFALAKTEITNSQYEAYDPEHGRDDRSPGDDDPVVEVSWEDARGYCEWLALQSGREIRLPSESEWEAACRAGSLTEFCFGDDDARLGEYAWYAKNADFRAHEVATRKPNAWGFHDLHGNVWEWCEDRWHDSYLLKETVPGPDGRPVERVVSRSPRDGQAWIFDEDSPEWVVRGGYWLQIPMFCHSARRAQSPFSWYFLGFRPALGD
jgi:formylglycine-generating enzyme required for sulfatase activity